MKTIREIYSMNPSWKFHDGDITHHNIDTVHKQFIHPEWLKSGNNGLAYASYNDSQWSSVNLPHDFVIERGVYDSTTLSCTGSLKKGICWYRKTFDIPSTDNGKRLFLQFDGIFRDCEVWLNGCLIGRHLGGYMGFEFEITEAVAYGMSNTVAIKVDANEYEGWWYEGGGIYRDVRLLKTSQLRIVDKEIFVKTQSLDLENKQASLLISGLINNGSLDDDSFQLDIHIFNSKGKEVFHQLTNKNFKKYTSSDFTLEVILNEIDLWDLNSRNMYTVKISVKSTNGYDEYSTEFGIRKIKYSSEKGFELNDQTVKIKGVCGHDDFAGLGVALTKPIIEFKIKKLMEMGCNAYRCSHNPPNPIFLELCDKLGMLVFNETRMPGVDQDSMEDYINLIKRDRNHPCVISWSMGNEEMAIHRTEIGVQIFQKMMAIGKLYDDTRPYLYAINADYDNIIDYDRSKNFVLNPVGVNYFVHHDDDVFASMHKKYPDLCIVNTETTGICTSREYVLPYDDANLMAATTEKITVWTKPEFKNKVTCYGSCYPVWAMSPETSWKVHAERNYSAGLFLWTGFDYRGEVFPFDYPATISFFGLIDLCGFEKDWFYYMKSQWTDEDVLHLLPHWNMNLPEKSKVNVWTFTNCEEVELFVNGKSKGRKKCEKYGHVEWDVLYEKGTLEAVGFREGIEILRDKKITSKNPEKLILTGNRTFLLADNTDAIIVTAHLEDSEGNIVITSDESIEFEFTGPCEFIGTGNGNNLSSEHDKHPSRKLFAGKCIAIVKSTYTAGTINICGKWKNITSTLQLNSEETNYLPFVPSVSASEIATKEKTSADGGF
ncbi:glycoside hydrolase family 2 TIM barrel-domain containing protein [Clostridium grantii]|uniref:Beta-galactosidase n=1 Tax=Clostridium grantii DSM 8605 TaxID=1121316 RepID=A0A1M5TN79_9CLOT|nr:glycoside hydrolase family 2 TIM barrel-domain containing protein [Clostridium grantii]SHH52237.1 beta-galactosidase [Clostridium grantii DSM 8605]